MHHELHNLGTWDRRKTTVKILHLLSSNRFGGAENVVCQIIRMFDSIPDFEMVYCSPDGPIRNTLIEQGILFAPLERLSLQKVKQIIVEQRPDLIHAHDFRASVIAGTSTKKLPILSHLHSNPPWMATYNLKSFIYAATCPSYHTILTVSDSVFNRYVFRKLFQSKQYTIGNPINVQEICKKSENYTENSNYDIGFCGRLSNEKGPLTFLDILYQVKQKIPNINAAIVGDGDLRMQVEETIQKRGLSQNVVMYGFVSNPYPIIKNCKLLCMPSLWEGFGLVAVEALTLGVPVVCSNVGGLPGIVNNDCGKLCRSKKEYILEIIQLLKDSQYHAKKSISAKQTAKRLDNVHEYAHYLQTTYTKMLQQ